MNRQHRTRPSLLSSDHLSGLMEAYLVFHRHRTEELGQTLIKQTYMPRLYAEGSE